MNTEIFNRAVELIRRGESSLEIENTFENEPLGIDTLELRSLIADARRYVEKLQTEAFSAAVGAFERGETRLESGAQTPRGWVSQLGRTSCSWRTKAKADEHTHEFFEVKRREAGCLSVIPFVQGFEARSSELRAVRDRVALRGKEDMR